MTAVWKYCNIFVKAMLAGVMIAIGGTVFLSVPDRRIGAFLFAIGLFLIFSHGFYLFTGKVGYAVEQKPAYLGMLAVTWLGNFAGASLAAGVLHFTRIYAAISETAAGLCETKLQDGPLSLFVLSFFCGLLMFVAADNFNNAKNAVQKYLAVFLPVMVFILAGFEHCVANMYYFALIDAWSGKMLLRLVLMSLGNAAGGILLPLARKLDRRAPAA